MTHTVSGVGYVAVGANSTLAWFKTLPVDRRSKLLAGISADKEKELLAAWQALNKA